MSSEAHIPTLRELTEGHIKISEKLASVESDVKELKDSTAELVEWARSARVGVKAILFLGTGLGKLFVWLATLVGAFTLLWGAFRTAFPGAKITESFKVNLP